MKDETMTYAGSQEHVAMDGQNRGAQTDRVRRQRGIGALEYIGIAVFFVVVLLGVLNRTGKLNFSTNNSTENAALSELWQSIRQNVKSSTGYGTAASDLVPVLKATNGIPANLPFNGTSLQNTYGQTYAITSTGMGFQIVDAGITQADCIKIVVQQSASGNWDGGIKVGGGTATTGSISTTAAQTSCSGATNSITLISNE